MKVELKQRAYDGKWCAWINLRTRYDGYDEFHQTIVAVSRVKEQCIAAVKRRFKNAS